LRPIAANQGHGCFCVPKFFPIGAGEIAPSSGMTEYKIILDGLTAYGVEVSQDHFLSVRGFATELDAAAWIAAQQAGEAAVAAAEKDRTHISRRTQPALPKMH
jgi:hypothetical protein